MQASDDERTEAFPLDVPFGAYAPTRGQVALMTMGRVVPLMNRGRMRWQLGQWIDRIRPGPIDLQVDGIRYRFGRMCDVDTLKLVFRQGRFDRAELDFLLGGGPEDMRFADVGANMGIYGLTVAMRRPRSRVVFCEPSPEPVALLRANVAANDLQARAQVFDCAVGDREAQMTFHLAGTKSSLVAETGMPGIEVRVRPLLDILTEAAFDRLDAMKVDVEGYEDRVLGPFLADAPPALRPRRVVVEHILAEHWQNDAVALCEQAGYRVADRVGFNTLLELDA